MSAFLAAVVSFPTVVFTVALGVFLLYALATLVGALDIEALDGALGVDDADGGLLSDGLRSLGAGGIPIGIFGGVASLIAWIVSGLASRVLPDAVAIDLLTLFVAAALGLGGASAALRPLKKVFNTPDAQSNLEIVGKMCTIRSLRVDDNGGTAEIEDGGPGVVAQVRCFRENELTLGSKAIVYDYDADQGVYHVGPVAH